MESHKITPASALPLPERERAQGSDTRAAPPGERARLVHLRWLSIGAMTALALVVLPWLAPAHPPEPLLTIILILAATNLALLGCTWTWLDRPSGALIQLMLDLLGWGAFLYFAGGVTNPAISLLLPLVAVGAAILPTRQAWALALAAMLTYSLLWRFHLPLRLVDAEMAMHWHLAGMWLSFALSALTVVWFIVRLNAALSLRDQALASSNAARARDAYVVGLAKLAAGAAHRLGTPLATLRILSDELVRRPDIDDDVREDLELMREQIDHCRDILNSLTHEAGQRRAEGGGPVQVSIWLDAVLRQWRALRPGIDCRLTCPQPVGMRSIVVDASLADALINLLDNAANANARTEAGSTTVDLQVTIDKQQLVVEIKDRGPGLDAVEGDALGRMPQFGESSGMGVGLLLTHSAVEQHGGGFTLAPRPDGGTIARITIPVQDSNTCPK